jgi:hypothetical protein
MKKIICLLLCLLCAPQIAHAENWANMPQAQRRAAMRKLAIIDNARYHQWIKADLVDDDNPYVVLRSQIVQKIKNGTPPAAIANPLKGEIEATLCFPRKKVDPKIVFTYFYAKDQEVALSTVVRPASATIELHDFPLMIKNHAEYLPHTYNFARLVLIANLSIWVTKDDIASYIEMGKKLSTKFQDDLRFNAAYCTWLSWSPKKSDQDLALPILERMKKEYPNSRIPYATAGQFYEVRVYKDKNVDAAKLSIEEYKKYIAINPTNNYGADDARATIADLQKRIDELSQNKK